MCGQPNGEVAEIGQRRESRLATAKDRTEIGEERWAQAHFLGAGAQRNIDLEPTLIIDAAAERVVDQLVAVDRGVEHRVGGIGQVDIGIADHARADAARSEEHTSELQSLMRISYAVFCLKKKKKHNITISRYTGE